MCYFHLKRHYLIITGPSAVEQSSPARVVAHQDRHALFSTHTTISACQVLRSVLLFYSFMSIDADACLFKVSSGSGSTATGSKPTTATAATGVWDYTTSTSIPTLSVAQPAYPSVAASSCGAWTLVDNVCCPSYCLSDNESESCTSGCTGGCGSPPSSMCKSGTMCE